MSDWIGENLWWIALGGMMLYWGIIGIIRTAQRRDEE